MDTIMRLRLFYSLKLLIQIGLLFVFWGIGYLLQKVLNLPISAAVLGLIITLLALASGVFKLEWIKKGSDFILNELVLFFIPCVIGVMNYKTLLLNEGWQLIVGVILGTICVMIVTAYSIYLGFKFEHYLKAKRQVPTDHAGEKA